MVVHESVSRFRTTQTSPQGTNNHATFKVTLKTVHPHSQAQFELQQVEVIMSSWLNALS